MDQISAGEFDHISLTEDLQNGKLDAVCLVNVFNEGTSINELKSVFFMDKRQSAVNVTLGCKVAAAFSVPNSTGQDGIPYQSIEP